MVDEAAAAHYKPIVRTDKGIEPEAYENEQK